MTKEQLERWRSLGFQFDEFYDTIAKDTPLKTLTIDFISSNVDNQYYYFQFSIDANQLKRNKADIFIKEINRIESNTLLDTSSRTITLSPNGKSNYVMKLDKKVIQNLNPALEYDGFEFKAFITCDGLSSETKDFKISDSKKKEPENKNSVKKTCYCNRDFKTEELKDIIIRLRKEESSNIIQFKRDPNSHKFQKDGDFILDSEGNKIKIELSKYDAPYSSDKKILGERIFFLGDEKIQEGDNNFEVFTRELNKAFKDYRISTCVQKIHFLAQSYTETLMFTSTYEKSPSSNVSGGPFYRGRGLLHLTHDYNYKELYKVGSKTDVKPSEEELNQFIPKVAKSMKVACQAATWYWNLKGINEYANADNIESVSAAVNRPVALTDSKEIDNINGLSERTQYTTLFKFVMDYENCKTKK